MSDERLGDHWGDDRDDGTLSRSEAKMLKQAITNRWAIPKDLKNKMVNALGDALDANPDPYKLARLIDVAVSADRADLARDEFEAKEKRLDAESPTEVRGIRVIVEGVDHGEGDA